MAGALDGLLVVAIEQAVAAPMCTLRLADAGARVIKIERDEGDTARQYDKTVHGVSAYFAWLNRGKESICLNLKSGDDLAIVENMLAKADVFVQNLVPGATKRLGLGANDLVARSPRLIAVDIVGYGQSTDYRDMRAYDMLVQAESGICSVTGSPDEPAKVGVSIADIGTGINAHALILEALIARGVTGKGRAIEVAMFDSMADWMSVPLLHLNYGTRETKRHGMEHAVIYPYAPFNCSDGQVIIAIQHQIEWMRFCSGVLGNAAIATDPRFADNPARIKNRGALGAIITEQFGKWTCAEAIDRLQAHEIAWSRVSTVPQVAAHPALRTITVTHSDGTVFDVPRPAGRDNFEIGRVPALGEHSAAIRREFAR